MTALIILLSLAVVLIGTIEVVGRQYAARRADETIDDSSARHLYDRYLFEVEVLTQIYLLQASSDEEWLAATRKPTITVAASSPEKPEEDAQVRGVCAGRRIPRRPVLLATLLAAGISAIVYLPSAANANNLTATYTGYVVHGSGFYSNFWDLPYQEDDPLMVAAMANSPVSPVAFNPAGNLLAVGGGDSVSLWNVTTHTTSVTFSEPGSNLYSVAFSPDGKSLASGSADGTVRLLDAATGRLVGQLPTSSTGSVSSVAFNPAGNLLAIGGGDSVLLWNVATHTKVATFSGPVGPVSSVAFNRAGNLLAVGGGDSVLLWNVATHTKVATFGGLGGPVSSVAFSLYGNLLAIGGGDWVSLWNVASDTEVATFGEPCGSALSVAFSPHGPTLAVACGGGRTYLRSVS